MPTFDLLARLRRPALACAVAAVVVRLGTLAVAWVSNPLLRRPQLDALVYAAWARDIAGGDWLGREGLIDGLPFFFNPLYAYLVAPFLHGTPDMVYPVEPILQELAPRLLAVLVFQCLLGGVTTWLSARVATELCGRLGGWIAGIAVAFSTALVHLDHHLAVSGTAAFLVAGTLHSLLPRREGDERVLLGARGPVATALWLGLGALARPIPLLVVPFALWWHVRRSPAGLRAGAVFLLVFGLTATPTFVRNLVVADAAHVYTAAGGVNIHLGNNPLARRARSMVTTEFRFGPREMHQDARRQMQLDLGLPDDAPPSWSEVSSYYRDLARREFTDHPGESLVHYLHKARWFVSPVEVPSSANLASDLHFTPWLRIAFVPTALLAGLGLVGLVLTFRREEFLCAAGATALAHWATLTLVFPLSHYRSPAIPALAVLAAAVVTQVVGWWRGGAQRRALVTVFACAAVVGVGALPPEPDALRVQGLMTRALIHRDQMLVPADDDPEVAARLRREAAGRAADLARQAMAVHREDVPYEKGLPAAHFLLAELAHELGDLPESIRQMELGLALERRNVRGRIALSCAYQYQGRLEDALREARRAVADAPGMVRAVQRLAEVLLALGRSSEAAPYVRALRDAGHPVGTSCDAE